MTGMDVTAAGDGGSVVITVATASPAAAALRIPKKDLRSLIAHLQQAADKMDRPLGLVDEMPPGSVPSYWQRLESVSGDPDCPTIAIADATEIAGFAVLTLLMGKTHISLGIPKEYLSRVGAAFLAMSADPTQGNN